MFLLSDDKMVVYVYYGNSLWFSQSLHVCVLYCILFTLCALIYFCQEILHYYIHLTALFPGQPG